MDTSVTDICKYFIYGLVDPRTALVRYIGRTSTGLSRPRSHGRPAVLKRLSHLHSARWIRQLQSSGLNYEIVVLEGFTGPDQLSESEQWWILYGRGCGWPLTNATDGGEGTTGLKHTESSKSKMRNARLNKRHSPETIAKIARNSANRSPATIEKLREAGRRNAALTVQSLEGRRKNSEGLKGVPKSPQHRASLSQALQGHIVSPETRAKISASLKRRA